VTIGTLPDDILLDIFDFYVHKANRADMWHTLVHVCRTWRNVVFASPRRLGLQLLCAFGRSVKEMLDIWPELPIIISDHGRNPTKERADNVISALELNDRVSRIFLWDVSRSELERFVAKMQVPFPVLRDLTLWSSDEMAPVISDSFLGGSAPHLRSFWLDGIPFPALLNLLSSATCLVYLNLENIPHSSYISIEAIVTCLSTLAKLEDLLLKFQSPRSLPSGTSQIRSPLTRTILPALTRLGFKGATEYLEDLVARIDAPLLEEIEMKFSNGLVFDILQLPKFICRTEKFKELNQADVVFDEGVISIKLYPQTGTVDPTTLTLKISCSELDWQLLSLVQPEVCTDSALSTPSTSTFSRINIRIYKMT